jgi:hypothetical protein
MFDIDYIIPMRQGHESHWELSQMYNNNYVIIIRMLSDTTQQQQRHCRR